jgi:general secretion pathway protein F
VDFNYEAANADGQILRGQLSADSERALLQLLRDQHLTPISVEPAAAPAARRLFAARPGKVGVQETCQVVRELATLLAAGVPLAESVDSTAQAHAASAIGPAFARAYAQLRSGEALSAALRATELALPEYLFQLVAAGELTGKLAPALHSAADQMEYEQRIKSELRNALIYPSVLVASGIGATLLIFILVVPKFANMLKSSRGNLPEISVWVLKSGLFVKENLLWFGLGSAGLLMGGALLLSMPAVRQRLREAASHLPVIGDWLMNAELGRWAAMLGSLLANKVPIVRAMELAQAGVQLSAVSSRLQLAVRDLRGGKKLADSLALHRTVSPMGVNLVRVGERTGELPEMLRTLGRIYETASRDRMKRFLILFEPIAILVVGAVIGFIMVAIMLAITSFSTSTL